MERMEEEVINIGSIVLRWSDWFSWDELKADARYGGVSIPNYESGVYEVKHKDTEERLTIGKTSNLRMRIKEGLVRGKIPHSTGEKIRVKEDVSKLVIRWTVTDRPAAVEEELHRRYRDKFGGLPKYTERT
jgi:hypothetical protein